jgi:molybdopterin converting factor small subunit
MGKIKISYTYRLREITGKSYEILEIKTPASVQDLIDYLSNIYGSQFCEEIGLQTADFGDRSSFYKTFVDGKRIPDSEKSDPLIRNESEVTFLPITSGG